MNTAPDLVKLCYRCAKPVRMAPADYAAQRGNAETLCAGCRLVLDVEAREVGQSLPPAIPPAGNPHNP